MVSPVSRRIRRPSLVALGAGLGVLVLLIGAWAVDTAVHSGGVMRNVDIDGVEVGGLSQSDLSMVVNETAAASHDRPVAIRTPAGDLETTAGDLGLEIDTAATEQAALDAGRGDAWPLRPFAWFGRLFSGPSVPFAYEVDDTTLGSAMGELVAANRTEPKEPAILLADGQVVATPGEPGTGISIDQLADDLVAAAHDTDPSEALVVDAMPQPVPPRFSDANAQQVAQEANDLANRSLQVLVAGTTTTIEPATLRTWMRAVPSDDGSQLVLGVDATTVGTDVTAAVGNVGVAPVELSWSVQLDGSVTYTPGTNGTKCCSPDSAQLVVAALRNGESDGHARPHRRHSPARRRVGRTDEDPTAGRVVHDVARVLRIAGAEHPPHVGHGARCGGRARRDVLVERLRRPAHDREGIRRSGGDLQRTLHDRCRRRCLTVHDDALQHGVLRGARLRRVPGPHDLHLALSLRT